ncbi:G2 and S phase-expressed protein 1 isoform 2-T2 [Mantella aurantiaca]
MDVGSSFTLLADEKFDFDISLSPSSAIEDTEDCDDEVFIGPVKHKEKCVSAAVQLQESAKKTSPPPSGDQVVWSPLSGDKFVEIFKEAHLLALQLECSTNDNKKEEPLQTVPNPVVEKFVQESKSKLKLFDTFNEVNKTPIAIKRETYCIQDSPVHQLPPSVQQQIVRPNKDCEQTDARRCQSLANPLKVPKVVKSLSVSPLTQKAKTPLKSTVSALSMGKMISRLQPMKATAAQSKTNSLTVGKPKAAKKSPLGRKNLNSMGSTEDLVSGNSSIDSSLNNSSIGQSKRTLTLPSKLNLSKPQFKTPSAATNLRRNTSSSSSSHSSINTSFNSSISSSISSPPFNAKLNVSLNTSLNTSINSSKLKPNTSRLALVRPLGGVGSALKMAGSDASNNRLKPNSVTKTNGNKPASVSMAQPQTPSGKVLRQTSAPNLHRLPTPAKPESGVKAMSAKPQARIMPTPTSRLKPPQKPEGLSPDNSTRMALKPTRLLSCGDIGSGIIQSTPIGAAKGMQMNSGVMRRSISATPNSKHISTLPTPVSRRTSGILTPRTVPRAIPSLRPTAALQASSKSSKKFLVGTNEGEQMKAKLPDSPSSPTEDNTAEIVCSLNFSPENKLESKKQPAVLLPQQAEVLLIDIEVVKSNTKIRRQNSIENDSTPLIDLSNTPELSKQPILLKSTNLSQLIDLSSPLINLSPAANKENMDSPLLKF